MDDWQDRLYDMRPERGEDGRRRSMRDKMFDKLVEAVTERVVLWIQSMDGVCYRCRCGEPSIIERLEKLEQEAARRLPTAEPHNFDEWCDDCKEYDHEKHCCPRFNRVIRTAMKEAMEEAKVVRCKDCVHKPYVVDVFHASYGDVPVLESDKCPCVNKDDYFYSHMPDDDWFCADAERKSK